MKTIKIGEIEYDLCENMNDILDSRFMTFKQYLLQSLERIDKPLFEATRQRAIAFLNKQQFYQAFQEFENYGEAIRIQEQNYESTSICFTIICLEKDEDQTKSDLNFFKGKLKKMQKEGLIRGFVEESVQNFIIASPNSFGEYSEVLKIMKQWQKTPDIGV